MLSRFDDINLMQRIATRDQQSFSAIYQQYGSAIYSLAYHVLQDATLAEEVTQDTFLKVWRQTAQWNPEKGNLKNWLLAITHFTAIDRLRKEHRQPSLHPEAIEDVEDRLPIGRNETSWQEGVTLHILVAQLPHEQASLIDLAFFRGLSHSEIAEETHIPLGTVKTRLRTGIQRLRELWLEAAKESSTSPNPSE